MIPKDWLKERIETEDIAELAEWELRRSGLAEDDLQKLLAKGPSPLWMGKWILFIQQKIEGDEFWYFESPPETWSSFCGAAGFALVRSARIVELIGTRWS